MKREIRNPKSHRQSEANERRTQKVAATYYGKLDLLRTWELQDDFDHDYIIKLRAVVRNLKQLLLHRADAKIRI